MYDMHRGTKRAARNVTPHHSGILWCLAHQPLAIMQLCCFSIRYGQQLVPLDDDGILHYKPGKCMELLGFTDKENIPRW